MVKQARSLESVEEIFHKHDFHDFKWIASDDIVISHWVRMKCMYGCPAYGKCAACPPNTPSVGDCREFFNEYTDIAVFRFEIELENPEDRHEIMKGIDRRLLELEKEVFLSGNVKTFLLISDNCALCRECTSLREDCKQPKLARPTPEAFAIDVFSSVKAVGYPIEVLEDYTKTMNRYAFLLVN